MSDIIETKNQELIESVTNQINSINKFIDWSNANLNQRRSDETFKKLIELRRKLKRIRFSLENKPAIAAFGESQKGKSYVISSLLAKKGHQLIVVDPKTEQEYNFIEQLNPITNDKEATGVVTRFTKSYEVPDKDFPIMIRILSIADILQILCDTAYNDVEKHTIIEHEDLDEYVSTLARRYKDNIVVQTVIDEDDFMNIRDYVSEHVGGIKAKELLDSTYFDTMARIVTRIQSREWPEVFSKLWYDNPDITELFRRLLQGYETIGYSRCVYVPISALNNKTMTLMSSLCLQQLDNDYPLTNNSDPSIGTNLLTIDNKRVNGFSKSVLSALTAEVVIQIPPETISEELIYHLEGILDESLRKHLASKGWNKKISKEFLKSVDIYDFPGARSPKAFTEEKIYTELKKQMLLRGKVRYLFNKYNDEQLINILLLCHDHRQNDTKEIPGLVEQWINKNIGSSVEERTSVIDKSVVSPLFIIATKFNVDMGHSVQDGGDDQIENRWSDRFKGVLFDQVLQATSNSWFSNWTSYGSFRNTYLLRDYKYSGINGNRLYEGYDTEGCEKVENDIEFHRKLRASFAASPEVALFFDDPELSWDAAATMNNDGSTRIIENLAIVAANVKESRLYRLQNIARTIQSETLQLMQEYFHDENANDVLLKAISRCGSIIAEFDVVNGKDNYFFGRTLHNLQIDEHTVFDFFYHELNNPQNLVLQNIKEYELIINRCQKQLSTDKSFEENLAILSKAYHISDPKACQEHFEVHKGISLARLFSNDFKQMSNSELLARGIVNKWLADIKSQKNLRFYELSEFNTLTILDLMENISAVAASVNLVGRITSSISPFVDALSVPPQILDMVADTTAEMINNFVLDFGYNYYDAAKISEIKEISKTHQLGLSFDYDSDDVPSSAEEISDLFDKIRPAEDNDTTEFIPAFLNYFKWTEFLMISFISAYNIPNYNVEANRQLGLLLQSFKDISI